MKMETLIINLNPYVDQISDNIFGCIRDKFRDFDQDLFFQNVTKASNFKKGADTLLDRNFDNVIFSSREEYAPKLKQYLLRTNNLREAYFYSSNTYKLVKITIDNEDDYDIESPVSERCQINNLSSYDRRVLLL